MIKGRNKMKGELSENDLRRQKLSLFLMEQGVRQM